MRKIFGDSEKRCHVDDNGNMTAVETEFFDGKCDAFVEGYCYDTEEQLFYPWKHFDQLDAAQREYERERLKDAEMALAILLGGGAV